MEEFNKWKGRQQTRNNKQSKKPEKIQTEEKKNNRQKETKQMKQFIKRRQKLKVGEWEKNLLMFARTRGYILLVLWHYCTSGQWWQYKKKQTTYFAHLAHNYDIALYNEDYSYYLIMGRDKKKQTTHYSRLWYDKEEICQFFSPNNWLWETRLFTVKYCTNLGTKKGASSWNQINQQENMHIKNNK